MPPRPVPIFVAACALSALLEPLGGLGPAPPPAGAPPRPQDEAGVWVQGRDRIVGGLAVVPVSGDLLVEPEALGIQLTARAGPALLWIESVDRDRVVVRGDRDVEFDYLFSYGPGAPAPGRDDAPSARPGSSGADYDRAVRARRTGRD